MRILAAVWLAAIGTWVQAADLEEIEVRGTRLHEMRAAVIEAEDRFYARYNDLNKIDEFDIGCSQQRATGTNLNRRVCIVKAVDNATAEEARAFLEAVETGGRPRASNATAVLSMKGPEYQANMLELLRKHPELRRIVRERDRLQARYDKARKERMKDRLVLVE